MENSTTFTDATGDRWEIELKLKNIEAVRRYTGIDILAVIDNGELEGLFTNVKEFVNMIFVLVSDQVRERFNAADYDAENQWEYEQYPGLKTETTVVKASRWFGNRINGETIRQMIEAFQEALINFFPNESQQIALRAIRDKKAEVQMIENEMIRKRIDEQFQTLVKKSTNVPELSESTRKTSRTVK